MSEYYAVIRSGDHLAHYGVKGMKWGVRKAIIMGDQKQLDRHFKKAAKKLAKLQDKALHSGKYAAKAAGYGAAAAATGALAIGNSAAGSYLKKRFASHNAAYKLGKGMADRAEKYYKGNKTMYDAVMNEAHGKMTAKNAIGKTAHDIGETMKKHDTKIRIGAGLATAGLGALAAKNAYTAAHGRKYMDKADNFRRAMDDTFAGTKYAGQYVAQPKEKKRKKRG